MKNTERLLGIALAVLALEGCRGPQQHAQQPESRPSQIPSASSAAGHVMGHGGGGGYAAGAAADDVVRMHDSRGGETLVARLDFLREDGAYRVLELNAETPFFIVESFVEQGRRARAAGYADPNAGESQALGDALAQALAPLDLPAPVARLPP